MTTVEKAKGCESTRGRGGGFTRGRQCQTRCPDGLFVFVAPYSLQPPHI